MARHPDDWARMTEQELLFMLHSGEAGSEDFEHAKAELAFRRKPGPETIRPDLDWCSEVGRGKGIPPRCPFASIDLCPRYFLSVSLLGRSGVTTRMANEDDLRLESQWKRHPCWPRTAEQEPGVLSQNGKPVSFSHFCPEVMFDTFGFFATSLAHYPDELDRDLAHQSLARHHVAKNDRRWQWAALTAMHYSDCPVYSPLLHGVKESDSRRSRILEVKPSFYGISIDLRALLGRLIETIKRITRVRR